MLEIRHLYKQFRKKEVLTDVSCSLNNGVYGLLGPNGAGKTTLLRCMLDLYPYKKGEIVLDGDKLANQSVGYLPQKSGTFPGLTVKEQLYYFANLKNMKKDQIKSEVEYVLNLVNLSEYENVKGRKLSGGMVRRLGIAQALLNHPRVILFDEPTTGLDPEERMRFKGIIRKIQKDSIVIMSTHIVEDVEAVCDKIIIMKNGQLAAEGTQPQICQLAVGKVFEVSQSELEPEDYIEKEKSINDTTVFRVLSKSKSDRQQQLPTVEDGYMCVLKGI